LRKTFCGFAPDEILKLKKLMINLVGKEMFIKLEEAQPTALQIGYLLSSLTQVCDIPFV